MVLCDDPEGGMAGSGRQANQRVDNTLWPICVVV